MALSNTAARLGLRLSLASLLIALVAGYGRDALSINPLTLEDSLQDCPSVQAYNAQLASAQKTTTALESVFKILFPGTPAVNSLLATLYISGPPNFLLALCPPNIDPSSLSVMVAFAVGGLLGDTLFHLLPEIFLGESAADHARFVMVNNNKNLLLGVAIIVGFMTFVAMDKSLRIATGGAGHSHEHAPDEKVTEPSLAQSSALEKSKSNLKMRGALEKAEQKHKDSPGESKNKTSIKLSAYLNLIADFTHNITDGLALSSSFYSSPTLGATTCAAVFFHEIPHEVGDFALLIQSGFTKRQAMGAQFITAAGAFLGTVLGITIQELGRALPASSDEDFHSGLAGTGLEWGDMLLPFTAGTFLYVGTVGVFPELLETSNDKHAEISKTIKQFIAMAAGAGIMLWISWA